MNYDLFVKNEKRGASLSRPRLAQRNEDVQIVDYIHQNPVVEEICRK